MKSDPSVLQDLAEISSQSISSFTTSESVLSSDTSSTTTDEGLVYLRAFDDFEVSQIKDIYRDMNHDEYYPINERMLKEAKSVFEKVVLVLV